MSVYLIDYENVHASGLAGVENCGIEDEIILLYGNDTSTIPMELHIQIANSKGKVQYHKIERTGKNYLSALHHRRFPRRDDPADRVCDCEPGQRL